MEERDMALRTPSSLVLAGLVPLPAEGTPFPPDVPLYPPGTIMALPDATLADAEQVFALADAAVSSPGEGLVRGHAADGWSLEPRLAPRTRTSRRKNLSAFVEEIDGDLVPSARVAGQAFLAVINDGASPRARSDDGACLPMATE